MEVLVNLVAKTDQKLSDELKPTEILTKYAIAYRYPDEQEPPEPLTQENCGKILAMAQAVFNRLSTLCGI